MKWLINMAKESIRRLKKLLNLQKKQKFTQSNTSHKCGSIDIQELINDLVSVDSMLCRSSAIACQQFQTDPQKLLEIIKNHHVGLEVALAKVKIKVIRSESGDEFDPEIMQAHPILINTDNQNLHGKVAISVTPRFIQVKSEDLSETLLQHECVMLYKYIKEK